MLVQFDLKEKTCCYNIFKHPDDRALEEAFNAYGEIIVSKIINGGGRRDGGGCGTQAVTTTVFGEEKQKRDGLDQ